MKKIIAIPCAAALLAVVPATPALADGAVITPDGTCFGFVPTATGGVGAVINGEISLSNKTKSGNYNITCKFDVPDDLVPPKTRKASDFLCGFPDDTLADYSRMIVTPGGSGTMTCKKRG